MTAIATGGVLIVFERRLVQWLVPVPKAECPQCGHSLFRLAAPRCPECGCKVPESFVRPSDE